jgi:hypothetical protein
MATGSAFPSAQSGRLHRRIRLTLPVKLLDPSEPRTSQNAVTENVSPSGARVVLEAPKQPDTLLLLKAFTRRFRVSARVVYCQPLAGGKFGVGLELQGHSVNWTNNVSDHAV